MRTLWGLQAQAFVWIGSGSWYETVAVRAPWQVSAALRQAGELFIRTYDRVFPAPQPREPSP